jgi:membrane associated rhomboid family serine protease
MGLSFVVGIIIITVLVSLNAFKNSSLMDKMMYSAYLSKHQKEHYRVLSHLLVHKDASHLLFNMMSLYFLGTFLEESLVISYGNVQGELFFGLIYILGGVFATLWPYLRNQDNPNYWSLGASGAVSAVIFAAIMWQPAMKLQLFFIPIGIPAYLFGPIYLGLEYYLDKRGNSGIAHDAHIGGALFGILFILIINIDKGKEFLNLIFG